MSTYQLSIKELKQIGTELSMHLSDAEATEYLNLMRPSFDAYETIASLTDESPPVQYARGPVVTPNVDENGLNAWAVKSKIAGASMGKLAGKTVAIKDNVAVAGLPMVNGSHTMIGFVPSFDATVVSRVLDEGATILGKATCEHFCLSGGSHTSFPGPVHNPLKYGYSAGGSSSGSAALVASGQVDMAIGSDQGGSIRIPSSFCGVYGMKPTHGLVPYTGAMPIEATVDHLGPITTSVADNALMLEAIAGYDGLDPRQSQVHTDTYTDYLLRGVKGMKIGILKEGFSLPNMDPEVAAKVLGAVEVFKELGAEIQDISVPEHSLAGMLWHPIGCEGLTMQMMHGNGMGFNWKGQYDPALMQHHADWRMQADSLSPSLKLCMLVGQYGINAFGGNFYAKSQNLARRVRNAYDQALNRVDLLLMPTLPITAQPLPSEDSSITERVSRALEMIGNTSPMDVTGHPAMSIPCGKLDGLPVGLMLVGKHFAEGVIYQAAAAYESAGEWRNA